MPAPHTVVGLGEILWDLLPSSRRLGGAPANFAYGSHLLGEQAFVASRIGRDELGGDIRAQLSYVGLADTFLQLDPAHPTATAGVQLDSRGQPTFEIAQSVAWDFLELTDEFQALAKSSDAICFGSLAQRVAQSRTTILHFLEAARPEALRIFDINLRQRFYSAEIIRGSLQHANVAKLNHEEVPRVKELLSIRADDELSVSQTLLDSFDLHLVCVTRGANGSVLCTKNGVHKHPGFRVNVKDTIGSGDAFTAALVHGLLGGRSLAEVSDLANRLGAWVATHSGAMPPIPEGGLDPALRELG